MRYYQNTNESGFSLVEVLVAITILLLVIVSPMQIIGRSINSTNFASEKVNAWFLAQEGLELVQKGRDDFMLQHFFSGETEPMDKFLTKFANCIPATNSDGCGVNIETNAFIPVVDCGSNQCKLYLDSTADRSSYQHDPTGASTPYTRVIKMEPLSISGKVREIKVTSTVSWRTGSLISGQKVEAVTYLFNVYDTD